MDIEIFVQLIVFQSSPLIPDHMPLLTNDGMWAYLGNHPITEIPGTIR